MAKESSDKDGIVIRQAETADIPDLVAFQAKLALHVAGGAAYTLKNAEQRKLSALLTAALADKDKLVVVAEGSSGRLVGMGYIYIWRSQSIWDQLGDMEFQSGIIDDIWVEPDHRRQGVFRAMVGKLVSFAEERGVHELVLEYSLANKAADKTWQALGFRPTGVRAAAFTEAVRKALSQPG